MKFKKIASAFLAVSMIAGTIPMVWAADNDYATRGEAADMLLKAADDYNSTVVRTDIIKGYEDGQLHEDGSVSRVQALVMLERAFGNLPKPTGHNSRVAFPAETFTDVPEWAQTELENVFDSGIVAGTGDNKFSPDDNVTKEQLELFIKRVYALYGTNEKDDFYATVNKDTLNTLQLTAGRPMTGGLNSLAETASKQVNDIIVGVASQDNKVGSKEEKISNLYNNILNTDARNKAGIEPIKKYLDLINNEKNLSDVFNTEDVMNDDLSYSTFMGFSLTQDLKKSDNYMLGFSVISPSMTKEFYENESQDQKQMYINYISKELTLLGEDDVEEKANDFYEFEKKLAAAELKNEDSNNIDKIYNIFKIDEIGEMFPQVDIDRVFAQSGLKKEDRVVISDVNLVKEFSKLFADENIDTLKTVQMVNLASSFGGALNYQFTDIANNFNNEFLGTNGSLSQEEMATAMLENFMPDYIGQLYAQKYFSDEAKVDVEEMVNEIISVYKKRINNLTWMSDETKAKAIVKLNKMGIKIGYPDTWDTTLDNTEIKSFAQGGSYFDNLINILKAYDKKTRSLQGEKVDKSKWLMYPYTVNACYSATSNDITFPAAVLQAPFYDVNNSREENLGSIGFIIAHEITHAFDSTGSKFDENGDVNNWWTDADRTTFDGLCKKVIDFYDGQEAVPGIGMNGKLTLGENIADLGSAACITEVASAYDDPDYKAMYDAMANAWAMTKSRGYAQYVKDIDTHSDEKLRINRVLVNIDKFYETYGIKEGDGMYVAPEDRISIW